MSIGDTMEEDGMRDVDCEAFESESESERKRDGLLKKVGDISCLGNAEWVQKPSIDIGQEQEVDVNDNLERELSFYTQAKEGTTQVFEILQLMRLPFLSFPDYYAEMVKTDANMEKEKIKLLEEKKKIEAEERRAREIKNNTEQHIVSVVSHSNWQLSIRTY
uniref:Uncharacterized protein n=1 Tax=Nelumbo nucifera TaxID=4432 RepID=A0A822YSJ2_NELNU|nr:TPA_asm: hypothetical protein HUJ06_012597 [Nelumbo nucifera]